MIIDIARVYRQFFEILPKSSQFKGLFSKNYAKSLSVWPHREQDNWSDDFSSWDLKIFM